MYNKYSSNNEHVQKTNLLGMDKIAPLTKPATTWLTKASWWPLKEDIIVIVALCAAAAPTEREERNSGKITFVIKKHYSRKSFTKIIKKTDSLFEIKILNLKIIQLYK